MLGKLGVVLRQQLQGVHHLALLIKHHPAVQHSTMGRSTAVRYRMVAECRGR